LTSVFSVSFGPERFSPAEPAIPERDLFARLSLAGPIRTDAAGRGAISGNGSAMTPLLLMFAFSCSLLIGGCASASFDRDGHEYKVVVKNRTHSGFNLEIRLRHALTDAQVPELSRVWSEHAHAQCAGSFRGTPSPVYQHVAVDGADDRGPFNYSHHHVAGVTGHVACRHP
jgi:hypothetical protein